MSERIDIAKDTIADVAAALAEEIGTAPGDCAGELKGRADALTVCAEAVARVAYGPSGGDYRRRDDVAYRYPGARPEKETGFR